MSIAGLTLCFAVLKVFVPGSANTSSRPQVTLISAPSLSTSGETLTIEVSIL